MRNLVKLQKAFFKEQLKIVFFVFVLKILIQIQDNILTSLLSDWIYRRILNGSIVFEFCVFTW